METDTINKPRIYRFVLSQDTFCVILPIDNETTRKEAELSITSITLDPTIHFMSARYEGRFSSQLKPLSA